MLYNFFGLYNLYWWLMESSDVLCFFIIEIIEFDCILQLFVEQVVCIREMMVIIFSLMMSLIVDESDFFVYLVG